MHHGGSLRQRLQREPWCPGVRTVIQDDRREEQVFKIATPREIHLNDDESLATTLKLLYPPNEPLLTTLYEEFGSLWLSDCVHRIFVHTGMESH